MYCQTWRLLNGRDGTMILYHASCEEDPDQSSFTALTGSHEAISTMTKIWWMERAFIIQRKDRAQYMVDFGSRFLWRWDGTYKIGIEIFLNCCIPHVGTICSAPCYDNKSSTAPAGNSYLQCYWEREGYSYGSKWKAQRNLLRVLQEDAQQGRHSIATTGPTTGYQHATEGLEGKSCS